MFWNLTFDITALMPTWPSIGTKLSWNCCNLWMRVRSFATPYYCYWFSQVPYTWKLYFDSKLVTFSVIKLDLISVLQEAIWFAPNPTFSPLSYPLDYSQICSYWIGTCIVFWEVSCTQQNCCQNCTFAWDFPFFRCFSSLSCQFSYHSPTDSSSISDFFGVNQS